MRYHGGKFRLAEWVISHFPAHEYYVEPFGGAAGVLMQKPICYSEVYNDLNRDVVNLFHVLRDQESNLRLRELCCLTPYSREEFERAYLDDTECKIEKALKVIIKATMGFGTSGSCGDKLTGFRSDSKRKYGTASHLWARYPDNLGYFCERLTGVMIENKPAIDLINNHDGPETLFYLDPPYVHGTRNSGNRTYKHEMSDQEHIELLETIKKIKGMVVISGYESDLYMESLKEWTLKTKKSRISGNRGTKVKTEFLWLSPNIKSNQLELFK